MKIRKRIEYSTIVSFSGFSIFDASFVYGVAIFLYSKHELVGAQQEIMQQLDSTVTTPRELVNEIHVDSLLPEDRQDKRRNCKFCPLRPLGLRKKVINKGTMVVRGLVERKKSKHHEAGSSPIKLHVRPLFPRNTIVKYKT